MFRNLKRLRKKFNMTQAQLAEATGIHFQTLSKFERGTHVPKQGTIEFLARAFGMTSEELIRHLESPDAPPLEGDKKDSPPRSLKGLRERARLTQGALAKALNISAVTISNMENGKHHPSPSTSQKMADFFGIPLDDFYDILTGDGSPFVRCEECMYWSAIEHTRDGECLYANPSITMDKITRRAVWPVTDKDRKCGKGRML